MSRAQSIFVIGGIGLALFSVAVSTALTLQLDVAQHIDISMMCGVLLEDASSCRADALVAGYTMLAGLLLAALLAWLFIRRFALVIPDFQDAPHVFMTCLLAVAGLLAAHVLWDASSEVQLSRIAAITQQSSFISLENLIWPLLLQLGNSSRDMKYKLLYFSLTILVASWSPYRGVLLSVLFFGMALPLLSSASAPDKLHMFEWKLRRQAILGAGALFFMAVMLLLSIYIDTNDRSVPLPESGVSQDTQGKLEQRLAYPLFQAYFATRMAALDQVPSMGDAILSKLRLASGQNLNQFLYEKVYGGGSVGEMTSLYVGESAANSKSSPLVWSVLAPFSLALLWLGMQRAEVETGTLIGIAIWRGSLGGVAEIMPTLMIQLLILFALSRWLSSEGRCLR